MLGTDVDASLFNRSNHDDVASGETKEVEQGSEYSNKIKMKMNRIKDVIMEEGENENEDKKDEKDEIGKNDNKIISKNNIKNINENNINNNNNNNNNNKEIIERERIPKFKFSNYKFSSFRSVESTNSQKLKTPEFSNSFYEKKVKTVKSEDEVVVKKEREIKTVVCEDLLRLANEANIEIDDYGKINITVLLCYFMQYTLYNMIYDNT
jgi:hypothetical protein